MHPLRRPEPLAATRISSRPPLSCGLLLLCALAAQSQTTSSGAIGGRLTAHDYSGLRADITVQELATGLNTTTHTTRTGDFLLTPLTPGDYSLHIHTYGAPDFDRDHVPVVPGAVTPITSLLAFQLPDPEDPIPATLSQAAPDSDAQDEALPTFRGLPATENLVSLDGSLQTQFFSNTPAASGSVIDPEANPEANESDADTSATSRASTASRSIRSAAAPFAFARSSVREFHLTGDLYSAQYGGAAGGILAGATRSGTSRLHGSAFLSTRNSALAATNPYALATTYNAGTVTSALVKPHDARNQFGGSLSGALLPRRIFFFAAVDAQHRGFPAISSPQDPNFYSLTPTQRALLLNRGVRTTAIASALTYLDSLTGPTDRRADGNVAFARLDLHATHRLAAALEYNRARWNQPAGALSAPVVSRARASIGSTSDSIDTGIARLTATLTPFFSNELVLSYGHDLESQSPQPPLPQEPAIGPGNLPPEVAIGPQGLTFGTPAALGRAAYPDERRLQLADHLSYLIGPHHLQAGIDASTATIFVSALTNQQGTFTYDSLPTTPGRAGGLVDFITDATFNVNAYPNGGCPSITAPIHLFCFRSFTQSFGQQDITFQTRRYAAYLQDDYHLTPGLILHLGLRYDQQLLPTPQRPNAALDALFGTQATTSTFPQDSNNASPRLALSFRATHTLTLRAGYGIFYGTVPGATLRAALLSTDLPTSTTHIRILPSTITDCPQVAHQGFGYPCAYLASPASALPTTTSAILFSKRFQLPMVQQGSFTLEEELPARIALTATYRINLDRQLPTTTDLNIAPSKVNATYQLQGGLGTTGVQDGETFVLPLYTARLTNTVGPVTVITSSANATYHGLDLQLTRRTRTLTLSASGAYSRAIDFGPIQGAIPQTNHQLDPYNLRYDKSLSALNFPLRLAAQATWHPTLERPNGLLNAAGNGWSLTPLLYLRSGAPYSLLLSGGTRLPGGHESINGSGGATYLPTIGRNTLHLPDALNLDLRLARTLQFTERLALRLTAEAFNLTNHVNPSAITQRAYLAGTPVAGVTPLVFQNAATIATEGLNTRPFGTVTDSGTSATRSRDLQLGLRLTF